MIFLKLFLLIISKKLQLENTVAIIVENMQPWVCVSVAQLVLWKGLPKNRGRKNRIRKMLAKINIKFNSGTRLDKSIDY